jgi:uncharacterized membrane protein YcaP (DUF421 family)
MLLLIDLLGLHEKDLEWYQMFTRTIIVFITAIAFIRVAGMRSFGTQSAFDVVLSITLGALLSRCITGHYPFFATLGTALFLALLHRSSAWLAYGSKKMNRILEGDAVLLYKDGIKIKKNLSLHSISDNDLLEALHEEGLEDFKKVKIMRLEPDGKISIVKEQDP